MGARGEGDNRGWDGWMVSLTRWTWVSVNSRSWWWTGRPGVLRFMGSQRVGHDWVTDLIWSWFWVIEIQIELVSAKARIPWLTPTRGEKQRIQLAAEPGFRCTTLGVRKSCYHCPDPQHGVHTWPHLCFLFHFLRLKATHLLIYLFQFQHQRVKTCIFSLLSHAQKFQERALLVWYGLGVHTCAEKLRVTRILFQLRLYAFSCNNKQWTREKDL